MQAEISYTACGDYFVPDLYLHDEPHPIGRWGRLRRDYLKKHRPGFYSCLILNGTLWSHLADINEQALEQIEYLVEQLKISEGLTEKRKADNPLEWTRRMNNLRSHAEEIIKDELIFT